MVGFARFAFLGLNFVDLAAANDPVRRTNNRVHCVVWGDGPYFGKKFQDEKQADQQFNRVKGEELVAIHYDHRLREVQRHQSPRVKLVKWHRLAEWCKEDHNEEASGVEAGVNAAGNVENLMKQSQASLLDASSLKLEPQGVADEVGLKATSSLVGTVSLIEKELANLMSKTSSLFKIVGQNDWVSSEVAGQEKSGKLKAKVNAIEELVSNLFKSTDMFEKELVGATETAPTQSQPWKVQISIKSKIESLLPKVNNLKKRISALGASSFLSAFETLESKAASLKKQAAEMLNGLGAAVNHPASAIQTSASLHTRFASLEEVITYAQLDIKTLEAEVLERPALAPEKSPKMDAPLKTKLEGLTTVVEDLQSRMSTLAASKLDGAVDKLEEKVNLLVSKATEVSKRVDSEFQIEHASTRSYAFIKQRISVLNERVTTVQRKLESLEEELLGSATNHAVSLADAHSLRGQVTSLEEKVDGLMDRAAAMEKEV